MATFPGWQVAGEQGSAENPRITGDLGELVRAELWPPAASATTDYPHGPVTDNLPVSQSPSALPGWRVHSFFFDWYFRVHIVPARIEFGALVARAVRNVEVWSAHFVGNNLASIDETGTDGLTLIAPVDPPTLFLPLDSRNYTLEADLVGPALLDALYTFNFDLDTATLAVTGERVVPWPFPPNWSRPVLERLEWRSAVLEAYAGKERRAQVRDGARLGYEYEVLRGGDRERVILEQLLHQWQSKIFGLPLWHQVELLAAELPAGALSIATPTDSSDYRDGGLAALVDGIFVELVEVESVSPGLLTLGAPTGNTFPAGSKVMPARLARLPLVQAVDYPSDAIAGLVVRFAGVVDEVFTPEAEADDYRGYRVLLDRRDWNQDVAASHARLATRLDYGTGLVAVDDRVEFSPVTRGHGYVLSGRPAVFDFRSFLQARRGRIVPLWIPSGHYDFELEATIGSTDTAMVVENRRHSTAPTQLGRRDFMLELRDGSRFYRRITDATELSPDQESIAFDSAFGQNVEPADVLRISYLGLQRLASDAVELAHDTDAIARVQLSFRLIRDDVP